MNFSSRKIVAIIISIMAASWAKAAVYDVGPGQAYLSIGAVPWSSLKAGDTVQIHYRSIPYAEKVLISSRGTDLQHIRVTGISGPNGEVPVLTGVNATTGPNMHYRWTDPRYQQALGLLQIGYRTAGPKAGYIDVSNLEIRGAR